MEKAYVLCEAGTAYIQSATYAFTEGNTYMKHEDITHPAVCVGTNIS
jgi:hypothetical protein